MQRKALQQYEMTLDPKKIVQHAEHAGLEQVLLEDKSFASQNLQQ